MTMHREYKVQILVHDRWEDAVPGGSTLILDHARSMQTNILTAEERAGETVEVRIVSREVTGWLPIATPKRSGASA
jgi:hypothetical protein